MRTKRAHGRILSVETLTRGSALAEDAAAGATSITVVDAGDFEETDDAGPTPTATDPLGWLALNGQVVAYLACDDDTGIIGLADPLAAAAEEGDTVAVWSDLYDEPIEYQQALVELEGRYDNPEPVEAEVAEEVEDLPEGDRGKPGESCTLKRLSDDEWEVIAVGGRSRKSKGTRFEQDDYYVLTAADVIAGSATMPLSHRPRDEALTCYLAGVPQRPTNWTVNYDARTLTIPLSGWEKAGDVLWVHYAYRKGIGKPLSTIVPFGATGWSYKQVATTDNTDYSAPGLDDSAWPIGTAPFGGGGSFPGVPTAWAADKRLWLRRTFPAATGVRITFKVEDFGQVYVNGNLVESVPLAGLGASHVDPPVEINVPSEYLNPAGNVIAVRCEDEPEMPALDNTYADLEIRGSLA